MTLLEQKTYGPVLIEAECSAELAYKGILESLADGPHRWTIKTESTADCIEAYIAYKEIAKSNGMLLALTHKLDLEVRITNVSPGKTRVELNYSWLKDGTTWNVAETARYCTNNIKLDLVRRKHFHDACAVTSAT